MSNGELDLQANPMRDLSFDGPTLRAVLVTELAGVQDAQGDVRGAHQRLVEQVQASQHEVQAAEDRLSTRQGAVLARVKELELVGREISFSEGRSWGEVREAPRWGAAETYVLPTRKNLAGVKGTIAKTEVGTKTGKDANGSDELLLHVDVSGRLFPPRAFRRFVVRTDETVFSIAEAPEKEAGR